MNSNELNGYIKLICETLNIKTDNFIVIFKIEEAIKKYNQSLLISFIGYIERNFNDSEIRFLSGYQKFLELHKRFEKGYIDTLANKQISQQEEYIKGLVEKIRHSKQTVEREVLNGKRVNYRNILYANEERERVFKDKDIAFLEQHIGSLPKALRYLNANGLDSLIEFLLSQMEQQVKINLRRSALLGNNQKQDATIYNTLKVSYNKF